MSVTDGQRVNAAVTNAAFVSRTTDSDTVAVVGLNNASSGGLIPNAQQAINDNATNITSNDVDIADLQANKENKSEKGQPDGYAELDSSGRVPLSQMAFEAVTRLGNWDASTNTPTLADGSGTQGDQYYVNVAGTQDLGSGSLTFALGDTVTYNGTIWQKQNFAGASSLNDLSDVDTTTNPPSLNDVLTYTGSEWEPQAAASASTLSYRSESANYTLTSTDDVVSFTTGGSDVTASLPQASVAPTGKRYKITKVDAGAGSLIVEGFNSGTELIDGSGQFYLHQQYNHIEIVNNGTGWEITSLDVRHIIESNSNFVAYPFAGNTAGDLTSILLPEGEWRAIAMVNFESTAAPPLGAIQIGVSTTAGNSLAGLTIGTNSSADYIEPTATWFTAIDNPTHDVSVSTATTHYLKCQKNNATTNLNIAFKLRFERTR